MSARSDSKSKLSRRKFLLGSAATAASAAVTVNSERASAFFNTFGFLKKPTGGGQTSNGYTIGQSLRFISANSPTLTRTFAAGTRTTWSLSLWCKRGDLQRTSPYYEIFSKVSGDMLMFICEGYADVGRIRFCSTGGTYDLFTTARFRDPSSWYHVVLSVDTTQATASDRVRVYVNGVNQTFTSASYPSQNYSYDINSSGDHKFGIGGYLGPYDGYLSEINFIDGYPAGVTQGSWSAANLAASFGQLDTNTGQWIPKAYSGVYGINGFYLKFADNSNTTNTTLGKDSSSNGNDWTPSGFATHDQVLDSPTNNFCILNATDHNAGAITTLAQGNLELKASTGANPFPLPMQRGSFALTSGKWYWEVKLNIANVAYYFGVVDAGLNMYGFTSSSAVGFAGSTQAWLCNNVNGNKFNAGTGSAYGSSVTTNGAIISVAYDADNKSIWWGSGGSWFASGNPATAANPAYSGLSGSLIPYIEYQSSNASFDVTFNFGQGGQTGLVYDSSSGGRFKYTPPAGFKALCAVNLAQPTIKKPAAYYDVITYTGNGSSQTISSLQFQPDLVMIKRRDTAADILLYDSARGPQVHIPTTTNQAAASNTPSAEVASDDGLTAFTSNGFSLGALGAANASGGTYVAYCWKKGPLPGLDIVTYTGDGTTNRNISHSLGAAPAMVWVFSRSSGNHIWMWHQKMTGASYYLGINNQYWSVQSNSNSPWGTGNWTPSQFMVSNAANTANANGVTYIAYLWAEIPGFSSFQAYTGNGSTDGPFLYSPFAPKTQMVFAGGSTVGYGNIVQDIARSPSNPAVISHGVFGGNAAETSIYSADFTSNGIKRRDTQGNNTSAQIEFNALWALAPQKYSTAR